MPKKKEEKKLTPKQKLFADYYLGEAHFNGTKAAELAGYAGNKATLAQAAFHNLRNTNIETYIDERLSALTMPANVVLTRLTEIAEATIEDVVDEDGRFNFDVVKSNKKAHLIKKIKVKRVSKILREKGSDEDLETSLLHEDIDFEMYSSHEALRDLGKHHKLFTDKIEQEINANHTLDLNIEDEIENIYGDEDDLNVNQTSH